jgi:hypothetical protein
MNLIEQKIRQLFKTQAAFYRAAGKSDNDRKNHKQNILSIEKKIAEINEFVDPLNLKCKIVEKSDD